MPTPPACLSTIFLLLFAHLAHVELELAVADAEFVAFAEVVVELGPVQVGLGRHAADVEAGAAQLGIFFDAADLEAVLPGADRGLT
jgi:hypothetical protein